MKLTLLRIRPTKTKDDSSAPKRGPLLMEQAFAALHNLPKGKSATLEIGNFDDKISFFTRSDDAGARFVEGQIYAQYPDSDIDEIPLHDLEPKEDEEVHTTILSLGNPSVFPIKRHPQFDDLLNKVTIDPLSVITSTMSRFPHPRMRGHVAIAFRPMSGRRRRQTLQFLPLLKKGLPRKWGWYRNLFMRAHFAHGWKKFTFFPIDMLMGGWRAWFVNTGSISGASSKQSSVDMISGEMEELEIRAATRSHDREDTYQGAQDKMERLLFEASVSISIIAPKGLDDLANTKLHEIAGGFNQFSLPKSNSFTMRKIHKIHALPTNAITHPLIFSNEELATLWHLPTILVKTPNIDWVTSRKLEPPNELPLSEFDDTLTTLGEAVFRGTRQRFGIKVDDRRRHIYVIGKTGMGKSTILENMIFSDIHAGKGVAVIDPHGDLAEACLRMVPKNRSNDVVLFDPTDLEYPIAFNMLECSVPEQRPLVASGIMAVFTKIWPDMWSGRMEHIMRNTLLSLLESPGNSMLGILRMYADDDFRKKVVAHLTDPLVRSFWEDEYDQWSEKYRTEALAAIQNKVGQLLTTPIIRNVVGQSQSKLDIRHAMDSGKIMIANLSKGKLGEDNAGFLGSMLVTKFQIDAMSRADIPEKDRRDFYLYVDEFQNFATSSFATILSEARKYKLNLTMANQYIGQLTPDKGDTMLRDAVFGNVGTLVSFQVGSEDAEEIAQQFNDDEMDSDILGLPKYHAYMRLMINGITSPAFSVATLPPPDFDQGKGRDEKIRNLSRERYAVPRKEVEEKISKWAKAARGAKEQQRTDLKRKEKEEEEKKKARKKGMKLEEYRAWRDREMWTNSLNSLKKKLTMGEKLSDVEKKEMEDLTKKLDAVGGPTVKAAELRGKDEGKKKSE